MAHPCSEAFMAAFKPQRSLLVGGDGIPLEDHLLQEPLHWLA